MINALDPQNMNNFSEASVSVEIETEDMTLNIGPQHPSTHGVLRLVAKVDGEKVHDVKPVLGYMHRGYEKLAEVRTYPQITTLVNRIDWVAGFSNEIPFIAGAERLMEIEVPERAKHIRLILTEMARISSHFVFNGAYALEVGALTPIFYAMEDRERVLDLIESVTGGRFHPNFNRIGGVKPAETAEAYGVSGPILRASGIKSDLRTQTDYLPYDQFDYDIPVGENGDCYDRWDVRVKEMVESAKIVLQAIDSMPSGPLQTKVPKVIKVPKGRTYVRAENPKGEMGYYIISDGGLGPYRLKVRTASFSNVSILPIMLEGALLPDLIAIMGSLDFVLGDVDR